MLEELQYMPSKVSFYFINKTYSCRKRHRQCPLKEHAQPQESMSTKTSKKGLPSFMISDIVDAPTFGATLSRKTGNLTRMFCKPCKSNSDKKEYYNQIFVYRRWPTQFTTTAKPDLSPVARSKAGPCSVKSSATSDHVNYLKGILETQFWTYSNHDNLQHDYMQRVFLSTDAKCISWSHIRKLFWPYKNNLKIFTFLSFSR